MRDARNLQLASDLRLVCMRIARRAGAVGTGELAAYQYSVLTQLETGPLTPKLLADREGVSAPVMTRNVNGLEALGYVRRRPVPTDGRQVIVELTPAGEEVKQRIKRNRDAWMVSRISSLTVQEWAVLREATSILQSIERS